MLPENPRAVRSVVQAASQRALTTCKQTFPGYDGSPLLRTSQLISVEACVVCLPCLIFFACNVCLDVYSCPQHWPCNVMRAYALVLTVLLQCQRLKYFQMLYFFKIYIYIFHLITAVRVRRIVAEVHCQLITISLLNHYLQPPS